MTTQTITGLNRILELLHEALEICEAIDYRQPWAIGQAASQIKTDMQGVTPPVPPAIATKGPRKRSRPDVPQLTISEAMALERGRNPHSLDRLVEALSAESAARPRQ